MHADSTYRVYRQQREVSVEADATKWRWIAATATAVMLAYFVVTNHVPLYPWNNLDEAGSQWLSTLNALIPFGIYAAGFALGRHWPMLIGVVHSYIWVLLQIRQWWIPYLFGETPLHSSFGWYVEHGYDDTVSILPAIGSRPVPDAQHLVLELLSLVVVVTMTTAFVKHRRQRASTASRA